MATKLEIKVKNPKPVSSRPSVQENEKHKKAEVSSGGNVKVQCTATRADKKQCTRQSTKDSKLCYWHIDHLKYGIYVPETKPKEQRSKSGKSVTNKQVNNVTALDNNIVVESSQQLPTGEPPKPKTRGRKRKQAIDPRFNDSAYITMWPEICEGICVLVDRNDNVYSYATVDTDPITFLGVKLLTGKIDRTANPRSVF